MFLYVLFKGGRTKSVNTIFDKIRVELVVYQRVREYYKVNVLQNET